MNNFTFYIKDFGCRINQYDASKVRMNLNRMGKIATSLEEADVVIINTCSVTHRAEKDGVKYIRRVKRTYPEKEILAMGCSVRDDLSQFEHAGAKTHTQFMYLNNPKVSLNKFYGHTRAFISIQQGCNGACTYCIVKKLKQPYFIKSIEDVAHEMRMLSKNHPEFVICATNFNEYPELLKLIHRIKEINADFRWRFSSVPPESLTKIILQSLNQDARFCRHFHIPLQSANDMVLEKMKRSYRIAQVIQSIERALNILDDVVFSFDIMVGFPGETEKNFRDTLNFIKKFSPVKIHIFRYSDRPGTSAYYFNKKVPERVKKERMNQVKKLSQEIREKHFAASVGKIKEIVAEKDNYGYTREYLPVKFMEVSPKGITCEDNKSVFKKTEIVSYDKKHLIGRII